MKRRGSGTASTSRYTLRRRLYNSRELTRSVSPSAASAANPPGHGDAPAESAGGLTADDNDLLRETIIRQRAEFDNFRKRSQKEKETIRELAAEGLLARLLPVLDNLDRAMASAENAVDVKSVRDGVGMISAQLARALESEGLQQIKALHEPFDPTRHDALAAEERDDVADGHVCEVLLPGYIYKEKLLRPAMVKVARKTTR